MQMRPFICTYPVFKSSSLPSATPGRCIGAGTDLLGFSPNLSALFLLLGQRSQHFTPSKGEVRTTEVQRNCCCQKKGYFMATKILEILVNGFMLSQPPPGIQPGPGMSSRKALRRKRRFSKSFHSNFAFSKAHETNVSLSTQTHSFPPQFKVYPR